MRSLFILGLLSLLTAALAVAQEEKKDTKGGTQPIKVVEIDRKEPVLYDKDIEPILVKKCLVCHGGQVKEGKFDLILRVEAPQLDENDPESPTQRINSRVVLFANESVDITDAVLKVLNADYAKEKAARGGAK